MAWIPAMSGTATLREVGSSDRDILDIVEVTAHDASANRVADWLGIETESWISDR